MNKTDMRSLCEYARQFSGLTDDKVLVLQNNHHRIFPRLPEVTAAFYDRLAEIPKTQPFLEGRLESLKKTHHEWLEELFTSDYGDDYTAKLYHVGDVHVKVKLPVEFMSGAMTVIQGKLMQVFSELYPQGGAELVAVNDAINSATGFSLQIMQESYQSSSLTQELEQFLAITGMSRALFDNLARAYR